MQEICTILTYLMAGLMFVVTIEKKIGLLLVAVMTLSLVNNIPIFANSKTLLVFCFFISEIKNIHNYIVIVKRNQLFSKFLFVFSLMIFIDIIFSPNLHSFHDLTVFIISEFFAKYLIIILAFIGIKNAKSFNIIIKYSIITMYILTVFGIINLITGHSEFVNSMTMTEDPTQRLMGEIYTDSSRFRVQSMFQNPFNYGFYCCLCLLIYLYAFSRKIITKKNFASVLFCCLFGIITCGCRTILVCGFISILSFFYFTYNLKKFVNYIIILFFLLAFAAFVSPYVRQLLDYGLSIITDTEGKYVSGSSMSMRAIQISSVLSLVQDSPFFGKGEFYFLKDLGWADNQHMANLAGLEGVYLYYILHRGFIGYFLYIILWLILIKFLVKNLKTDLNVASLGISVFVLYKVFAYFTGELTSVFPTLLVLGCVIRLILNKKNFHNYEQFNLKP